MTLHLSNALRRLTVACLLGSPLLVHAQLTTEVQFHAGASQAIDLGGVAFDDQNATADYYAPGGMAGEAATATLPGGSHAVIGTSGWRQGWQIASEQTAGVNSWDSHSGGTADSRATVSFSIQQPGVYQLWLEAIRSMEPTPGQGSSFDFTFQLMGGTADPDAALTVFDLDTAEPLSLLEARFLPVGDYVLRLSTNVVMSARADPTLWASSHFGISPIPEPGTGGLLAGGLALLAAWRFLRPRAPVDTAQAGKPPRAGTFALQRTSAWRPSVFTRSSGNSAAPRSCGASTSRSPTANSS